MTTTPRRGDRPQSAQGLLCARGSRYRRRLCRHFRPDRRTLFPALGRSVGCAGAHRRQEPQERRRQSLRANPQRSRLRVLPHREREESASSPARSSAPIVRWSPTAPRRWCSPTSRPRSSSTRPSCSAPRNTCRTFCRCRGATCSSSKAARWPGSARWRRPAIGLNDLSFAEVHDCFTIAELIEYEAMGLGARRARRARHRRRHRRQGRRAADQSVRRA